MTVTKKCQRCGNVMVNVQPCKRFCDACIKEKARRKDIERRARKKAEKQGVSAMQAKRPAKRAPLKPLVKSIKQCVREADALEISYGQYVQRGLDKE